MKQISIAIPTWERTDLLYNSFSKVINDDRVGEIVIVDDCSSMAVYEEIKNTLKNKSKVKLYRNEVNFDCHFNKFVSVSKASNEFVIILDSDNEVNTDYLDRIYEQDWDDKTILQPSWAMPTFDFREYEGITLDKSNVSQYKGKPMLDTMLNACNYFVNRHEYMAAHNSSMDENPNPVTADSIFVAYHWMKNGGKIKVVPNLYYQHLVHDGSHYKNNVARTPSGFYESVIDKLKQLR